MKKTIKVGALVLIAHMGAAVALWELLDGHWKQMVVYTITTVFFAYAARVACGEVKWSFRI